MLFQLRYVQARARSITALNFVVFFAPSSVPCLLKGVVNATLAAAVVGGDEAPGCGRSMTKFLRFTSASRPTSKGASYPNECAEDEYDDELTPPPTARLGGMASHVNVLHGIEPPNATGAF